MARRSASGHLGSCFSVIDILVALYFDVLRIDAAHPDDPGRDRCILSKGHAAAALYAVLAERGHIIKLPSYEELREMAREERERN